MDDKSGYAKLPKIIQAAPNDIKHHLAALYWLARISGGIDIIELGVRSGDSTRALLAAAQDMGGHVWSYDIDGDAYRVKEVTEKHGIEWVDGLWTCTKSDSIEAANGWGRGTADIVFVDTTHELVQTQREIYAWQHTIRPRGMMVFHDSGLNEPNRDGVGPAVEAFANNYPNQWSLERHDHCAEGDMGLAWLVRRA
jgi:predicted O-methyltransferase YrrM